MDKLTTTTRTESESNKELPDDLIWEILLKLPIKPMFRFKSVSKNWLTLIHSNPFAFALRPRSQSPTFFVLSWISFFITFIVPISVPIDGEYETDELPPPIYLQQQFAETKGLFNLFSVGHGILGVFKSMPKETVYLWNPTTNQKKVLPPSPYYSCTFFVIPRLIFATVVECKDDAFSYKVGRLSSKVLQRQPRLLYSLSLELYSSETKCWKFIPSFYTGEISSFTKDHCANLNGKVHWVIQMPGKDKNMYIAAFDYETEVFTRIKGPKVTHGYYDNSKCLVTLFDDKFLCLGLSTQKRSDDGISYLDIWVLRQYENEDSWVKEFTVGPLNKYIEVLGFSSKMQTVFLRDTNYSPSYMMFCDCKTSEISEDILIPLRWKCKRSVEYVQVVEHVGSLVPPLLNH